MHPLLKIISLIVGVASLIITAIICVCSLNEVPSMIRDEQQDLDY